MFTPLLLGLAFAAIPIEDIEAQYVTETGASVVACTATGIVLPLADGICYGMLDGKLVASTYTHCTDDTCRVRFTPYASAAPAAAPSATAPSGEGSFGPGMWLVGPDIAPGTYRATTEDDGSFALCAWSRLSGVSGDSEDLITYESVYDGGVQVLTEILPTDYAFDSHGCGTWTPV